MSILSHLFVLFPRVFRSADNELFDFFELVNSESSPGLLSVGSSLLSEAGGESGVLEHLTLLEIKPLFSVESGNGLLGGGNKIVFSILLVGIDSLLVFFLFLVLVSSDDSHLGDDLVELFIEVRELAGFSHDILLHEEGWLDCIISSIDEEFHCIGLESLTKKESVVFHIVSSSSSNFASGFWVISVDHIEDLMMVAASWFLSDFFFGDFAPGFYDGVEIFIFFDED